MNYKIRVIIISLLIITLIGGSILDKAKADNLPITPVNLPELPNPGLMPGDFFYFLDGWGESIEEFFTFNHERKAILQTERVLERIAEINALLERKGVEEVAVYLDRTEKRMQKHMIRAADILERQKDKGIDVTQLAKRLDDEFDARESLLESVFDLEEARLEIKEEEKRIAIREARLAGNFERVNDLRARLEDTENQKYALEHRKDEIGKILEVEEGRIEIKMEVKERELEVLAEEAEELFDQKEDALEKVFEQKERELESREEALEVQLEAVILAGYIEQIERIKNQLLELEQEEEILDVEKDALEQVLEREKRGLRIVMEMRERAKEQIQDAQEELLDAKEEIVELQLREIPARVLELIEEAETKLVKTEQAFVDKNYKKAFSQAITVEMLAINAKLTLESTNCAKEGEQFSSIFRNEFPEHCCEGLTEWHSGFDTRISIADKCYETDLISGWPVGTCINCGNGICEDIEDVCNCPEDCKDGKNSNFASVEEYCNAGDPYRLSICEVKSSITALSPDGGERWKIGETYDIKWDATGMGVGHTVTIMLWVETERGLSARRRIISGILADVEKFSWTVALPDFAEEVQMDRFKIYIQQIEGPHSWDMSDNYFSIVGPNQIKPMRCQTDADCMGIFCPMVIGGDTLRCNVITGGCYCGPSDDYIKNNKPEQYREYKDTDTGAFYLNNLTKGLDKEMVGCIDKCLEEIKVAKTCAQNVTRDNTQGLEKLLKNRLLIMMTAVKCSGEWSDARNCFQKTFCYQLFLDELREKDTALYRQYKDISPFLNF